MNDNLSQSLPIDVQSMMESSIRHIGLQRTHNNKVRPVELLAAVESFVDVSENLLSMKAYHDSDYTT